MSEILTEAEVIPADCRAVRVPAGELAAFGLAMERAQEALATADARIAEAVTAERKRIRLAAGGLKFTLGRPGNGPGREEALDVVPLEGLLRLLGDGNG